MIAHDGIRFWLLEREMFFELRRGLPVAGYTITLVLWSSIAVWTNGKRKRYLHPVTIPWRLCLVAATSTRDGGVTQVHTFMDEAYASASRFETGRSQISANLCSIDAIIYSTYKLEKDCADLVLVYETLVKHRPNTILV